MSPTLSIVTVVKDDPTGLTRTRDSLRDCNTHDLHEIEWIIVDSSTDSDAVPRIVGNDSIHGNVHWVPPEGVYEAMNVGLHRSTGDYVYFLNAGDRLHDPQSLSTILGTAKEDQPTWFYGQVAFVSSDGKEVVPPPFNYQAERAAHFSRGRFPPHQGTIVRRDALLSIGGFDPSYRITADYTAMLQLSLIADPIEIPEVIAEFSTGGLSESRWLLAINEFHRARLEVLRPRGWNLTKEFASTASQALRMSAHRLRTRRAAQRGV